jgi:hypothetical protein
MDGIRIRDRLYIAACALVSIIATILMPDYTNRDISEEHA